jgi:DNA-binding transcriptional LysR family regulator
MTIVLDLKSVQLFVLAVDLGNFSRAAEAAGTVQPVVSQRIRALEQSLDRRLLERTSRYVRPTVEGTAFLVHARALLAAHDAAARFADAPAVRFALGASDHAIGTSLETVIRAVRASLPPQAVLELRLGFSQDMRALYDAGELDAIVIRREAGGNEGEVLGRDPLGWRGRVADALGADRPVPLATLGLPCGVRAVAVKELDRAARPWRETFIGSGCAAVAAAAAAGLGIAPMGAAVSGHLPDIGAHHGLPPLPASELVLLARATTPDTANAIRALSHCIRALLRC